MRDQSEQVAERVRALLRQHESPSDAAADSAPFVSSFGSGYGLARGAQSGFFGDDADHRADDARADSTVEPSRGRAEPPEYPDAPRHGAVPVAAWRRLGERIAARVPVRVDPGRGPALALGLTVLVAALVTGAWVLLQRPHAAPVSATAPALPDSATPVGSGIPTSLSPSAPSAVPAAISKSTTGALVVVDVAGKVRRPGLYRLPPGARIDDAVRAAGGATHGVDLSGLNLAQKLVDGQQILVGAPEGQNAVSGSGGSAPGGGQVSPDAGSSTAGASASAGAPVDLNTATLDQLEVLPGVGPVLAQHILDWRTQHGSFTTIDQLDDVSGIGTVKFAALKSLVTV